MRRRLLKLFLWSAATIMVAACLGYIFRDDLGRAYVRFVNRETQRSIARYGAGLPSIDEVRLLRIDNLPAKRDLGTIRVPIPRNKEMAILAEKTLTGKEAQELAGEWRGLNLHTESMAMCYSPHHVVQFLAQREIICETVICFGCGNTSLPSNSGAKLVSFKSPKHLKFRSLIETAVGRHEQTAGRARDL